MHIDLIKGRSYPIGTVRTWKDGSKYKKVAVGKWVEIEDRGSIIKEIQGLLRKAISALTRLKLLSKDYERYLNKGDYNKALDEVEQALPEIDRIVTTYMENKTRERKSTNEKKEKGEKKQKAEYEESKEGKELKGKIKEVVKEVSTIKEQLKALKDKYGDKLDDALKARIDSVVNSLEKIEKKYNNAKEKAKPIEVKKQEEVDQYKNKRLDDIRNLVKKDVDKFVSDIMSDKSDTVTLYFDEGFEDKSIDDMIYEHMNHNLKNIVGDSVFKKYSTDHKRELKDLVKEKLRKEVENNNNKQVLLSDMVPYIAGFNLQEAYDDYKKGDHTKIDNYNMTLSLLNESLKQMTDIYELARKKKEKIEKEEREKSKPKEIIPEKEKPRFISDAKVLDISDADMSNDTLERAFRFISFDPEKGARAERKIYEMYMNSIDKKFSQWATEQNIEEMKEDLKKFKEGYITHWGKVLNARSKTASSFIVGSANFPVRSNQKKLQAEQDRIVDMQQWIDKVMTKMERKYNPNLVKPIRSDESDAMLKLKQKLQEKETDLDINKKLLKILNNKKLDKESKREEIRSFLIKDGRHKSDEWIEDSLNYGGRYMVNNTRSEVTRLKKRIESLEQEEKRQENMTESEKVKTINGVEVIENTEKQRLQLKFPGKPSYDMIQKLKRNGFKWSPSEGVWQRLLNNSSRWDAQNILKQNKQEA